MSKKKIYAFGDSIVYGHTLPEKCFMKIVAQEMDLNLQMYAVNGATVIKSENDVQTQIEAACEEKPDAVVVDGYTNDAYEKNMDKLGEITLEGMTEFDETTFCGGFEKMLYTMKQKWEGVPIVYVTIHKSGGRKWEIQCKLRELALAMCKKWDIQVVDMFADSELDTRDDAQMKTMIIDGAGSHPNEICCRRYYVPAVKAKLKAIFSAYEL